MLCSAQGFVSNDGRERILHTFPLGISWDWVWEWFLRKGSPMPRDSSGEHPGVPGTGSGWHPQPHSLGTRCMSPWLPPAPPTMGCTHLPPQEPSACHKMDDHPPGCPQNVGAPLSGCPSYIWRRTPVCPPSHVPTHRDISHTWMSPDPGCRLFLDAPHIWMCPHLRAPPMRMLLTRGCLPHPG